MPLSERVSSGSPLSDYLFSLWICAVTSQYGRTVTYTGIVFSHATIIFSIFKFLFALCVSLFCFDPKDWWLCHFVIIHQYFDSILFSLGFREKHNKLFPWGSLCLGLFFPQVQRSDLITPLRSWHMSSLVHTGIFWFFYYSFPPCPNPCSHSPWVLLSTTMVWYQRVSLYLFYPSGG